MIQEISTPLGQAKAAARVAKVVLVGAAAVVAVVAVVLFIQDPFGWKQKKIDKLEAEVAVQAVEVKAATAAAKVEGRRAQNIENINRQTEEAVDAVEQAPDLSAKLRAYGAGLNSVRNAGAAPVSDRAADRGRQSPR